MFEPGYKAVFKAQQIKSDCTANRSTAFPAAADEVAASVMPSCATANTHNDAGAPHHTIVLNRGCKFFV